MDRSAINSAYKSKVMRAFLGMLALFYTTNIYAINYGLTCGGGGCTGTPIVTNPPNLPSPTVGPTGLDYPDGRPSVPITNDPNAPVDQPNTTPEKEYATESCGDKNNYFGGGPTDPEDVIYSGGESPDFICTGTDGTTQSLSSLIKCPTGYTADPATPGQCLKDDPTDGNPKINDPDGTGPDQYPTANDPDNPGAGITNPETGVIQLPNNSSGGAATGTTLLAELPDGSYAIIDILDVEAEDSATISPIDNVQLLIESEYDSNHVPIQRTTTVGSPQPLNDGDIVGLGTPFQFTYDSANTQPGTGTGSTGGGTGSGGGSGGSTGGGGDNGTYNGPSATAIGNEVADSIYDESIGTGTKDSFDDETTGVEAAKADFVNQLDTVKTNLTNHFTLSLSTGAACTNPNIWTPLTGTINTDMCSYSWFFQSLGVIILLLASWSAIAIVMGD